MLALGCQFSDMPTTERDQLSTSLVGRFRNLLQIDFLDDGSLSLVQSLLLVAQYHRCTKSPSRCWNVIGMACRVAQGIGMHLDVETVERISLAVEMKRRVWHGCLLLDM
jgi:hypothetical protein